MIKEQMLQDWLTKIKPLNQEMMQEAKDYQVSLAKPPGSLGKLEAMSIQMAGITGRIHNEISKKVILVFAADNGVQTEGVSITPRNVTMLQAVNMTHYKTGMGALAKHFGQRVHVVDMGIYDPYECAAIQNSSLGRGTANIALEAAMTREQALTAVLTGIETVRDLAQAGYQVVGVGEVGIANTTTSAAVCCALTGVPAAEVVGRGAGLSDEGFERKIAIIEGAISRLQPDSRDVIDVLAKVGGFDICGMVGAFIGAAAAGIPVVIDGFISAVAALAAFRLVPGVKDYLFPSHQSTERGYLLAMREIGLEPWLNLQMRLGEGSGCTIAIEILAAACAVTNQMATMAEGLIDDSYLDEYEGKQIFDS